MKVGFILGDDDCEGESNDSVSSSEFPWGYWEDSAEVVLAKDDKELTRRRRLGWGEVDGRCEVGKSMRGALVI